MIDIASKLTPKQLDVIKENHNKQPLISISEGAVRSGKTREKTLLFLEHIHKFQNQNKKFIMTGSTISALKRNVLDDIESIFKIPTALNQRNEIKIFGNTIICFGSKDIDDYKAIKGFTAYGWYGNEITESHRNTIDQCLKRCSGRGFKIFWETNPDKPNHVIKTEYIDKTGDILTTGQLHILSNHYILDDNIYLTNEYKEHIKKTTPTGVFYDRDILGLWVNAEGMIYKDFNSDIHIVKKARYQSINYIAGVDWGYEHLGSIVVFGIDYDGTYTMIEEITDKGQSIEYWINKAKEINEKYGYMPYYCDSARPDYIADFQKNGINAIEADKGVIEGIGYIASMLKSGRLYFVENCKQFEKEIYNYRWDDKSVKEQPVKQDDDVMDAIRYALYTHKQLQKKYIGTGIYEA